MRPYELLFILRPDLDVEGIEANIERVRRLIEQNGGTVTNVDRWGKRRLAYEIKNQRDGYYAVVHFNAEPAVTEELERVLNISDAVLRHLIVRLDED